MIRVVELKLYLSPTQESTLETWLRRCCWLYNQALAHRIKAYQQAALMRIPGTSCS
jgi:hypothetical protein